MQFTKLFCLILDSTIWQESPQTKLLWITMLAMADRQGEVHASIPGLAKRAGITISECETGLECLFSPDPYSRTEDHEGRRIEAVDGGWRLLNHGKYRALLSAEERREYNRKKQAEYRKKKGSQQKDTLSKSVNDMSITVNHSEQNAHSTEAEADNRGQKQERDSQNKRGRESESTQKPPLSLPDEQKMNAQEIGDKIRNLAPHYAKPAALSYSEMQSLIGSLNVFHGMSEADWDQLQAYLTAHHSKGAGFWVPNTRSKCIDAIADVIGHAERWASKHRKTTQPARRLSGGVK